MRYVNKRLGGVLLGLGIAMSSAGPVLADDSEIYVGAISTVKPNILFIIDTSLSMDANDVVDDQPTFNPTNSYGGNVNNCNGSGRIFFSVGAGATPPTCSSNNYIRSNTTYQHCDKLRTATASSASAAAGRWTGKAAQYDSVTRIWGDLKPSGLASNVECAADNALHGAASAGTPSALPYAQNGAAAAWSNNAASVITWSNRTTYTFYSERWVKWNQQAPTPTNLTRIQAVKNAVLDMVSSIDDVNLGVMRFNGSSGNSGDAQYQGGVVTNAVTDVTANRNTIVTTVNAFDTNSATPLSEIMHEASRYWSGGSVRWGNTTGADSAARDASDSTRYRSPITESCQRNFNILLTDGRPTWDNQDNTLIEGLYGSACTGTPGDSSVGPSGTTVAQRAQAGRCLDEIAHYMARDTTDLLPGTGGLPGRQTVKTFTIGFGPVSDQSALSFLSEVATDGGGQRFLASNTNQLSAALTAIATDILNVSSTFTTASIGVNSFNRASTRDDLYFAVFNSDDHLRWDGNLKKYKLAATEDPDGAGPLRPRLVVSGNATPVTDAVDDVTGFFQSGTQSYWSAAVDGNNVTQGGAASRLPATRSVYTHVGTNPAGTSASLIAIDNAAVTDAILNTATGTPTRTEVLAFAKAATRMGDPMHSQPAVVTYGGTVASPTDVVYVATNDGYLHAVDASNGVEKWAFVPQELLARLKTLVLDPAATARTYGLDGDVRILRLDRDSDGIIESADGDVVWLFVGMRRGGQHYYGLDVTNPDSPRLMWKIGPSDLPDVGETWSPPAITRVDVSGATQNNQKLVLIFGGGYDPKQENYLQVDDTSGNNIFMVDAKTGARLWSAGNNASHDLNLAAMSNSIPGRITVLDINSDGFADRMYAGDLGGRVFRFDIASGNTRSSLVTGTVFAKLGEGLAAGGTPTTPVTADTRRFYNAPDVALIQRRGADPYYNIAIGSGYRGHPLHKPTIDRFYSLRDKQPFARLTTNNALTPVTEATTGLVDITTDPVNAVVGAAAPGWMIAFGPNGTATTAANATGEKVLSEATTVNGVLLFSTYQPQDASTSDPCRPTSVNRVYALRADNGRPALDLNNDGVITNADLYETVAHEGILGSVNVGVLRGALADALGGGSTSTVCLAGMHVLGKCVNVADSVRTYWSRGVDQP